MNRYNNYKTGIEKNIFDAVWQYVIDHADIDGNGTYFVKFHTNGKQDFAKHIKQRMNGLYRNDFEAMTELAEIRKTEQQKSTLQGMEKAKEKGKKGQIAHNLKELQRNHKSSLPKRSLWTKIKLWISYL